MPSGEDGTDARICELRAKLDDALARLERAEAALKDKRPSDQSEYLELAVEELGRSERMMRAIFSGATDAMVMLNNDGQVVDSNPAASILMRANRSTLLRGQVGDYASDPARAHAMFDALLKNGTVNGKGVVVRSDGEPRDAHFIGVANIGVGLHLLVMRDITDVSVATKSLARTEAELRQNDARFRAMVENSAEAIALLTGDGRILYITPHAVDVFGARPEEMVGKYAFDWIHDDDRDRVKQCFGEAAEGATSFEFRVTRMDGTAQWLEAVIIDRQSDPAIGALVANIRNVTARKTLEEQLRQAQKMEAVGRLAGGVAHDFNNLLSVVLSYTTLALEDVSTEDPLHGDLEQVKLAGERAVELTRQLLAFSRQQVLQPRVMSIRDTVIGLEKMLRRLLGADIELVFRLSSFANLAADPGQMEQVLMNLVINARDAMPDGGTLTVETTDVVATESITTEPLPTPPGRYVMLVVTDTGTGMDAPTRARIFEPFFTTKGPGKGTGLGLATVFGIVQQSGGTLDVSSEPGKTSFRLYFPQVLGVSEPAPMPGSKPPSQVRGSERILVAEDEEPVRALVVTVLRRAGYEVLEATDGEDAISILESQPRGTEVDLLLTDVVMPRMNGRVLATKLASIRPDLRTLFMSGYTDDDDVLQRVLTSRAAFLQKPITPDRLLRKVRDVLDEPETFDAKS